MNHIRCIICGETAGFLESTPTVPVFCSMDCDDTTRARGMKIKVSYILDMPKPFVDRRERIPDPNGAGWKIAPDGYTYVWRSDEELAPGCHRGHFELNGYPES